MGIISWIVLGLIAGALAKWIMPGKDPGGVIMTIVIGIVGAMIGGWLGSIIGIGSVTGVNVGSVLTAVAGSLILLAVYRVVKGSRA